MFLVIIIQKFKDGSPTAKSLFDYATKDQAFSVLYSTMASSMANDNISDVICMILNENGGSIKYERWINEEINDET